MWSTASPCCSCGSPGLPLPAPGDFYHLTSGFPSFQAHLQGLTIHTDLIVKPNSSAECGPSQSHLAGLSWGLDELTDCKWFPRYLAQNKQSINRGGRDCVKQNLLATYCKKGSSHDQWFQAIPLRSFPPPSPSLRGRHKKQIGSTPQLYANT